ncbi:O-antigen polymerase [Pseudomonas palleroniana]
MVFLPFFVVFIMFLVYQVKNKFYFGVVSYLLSIYLASFFCSIILSEAFDYSKAFELDAEAVLYFSALLFILLSGFTSFKDFKLKCISLSNFKVLRIIEWSMIPLSLFALVFFAMSAAVALTGDVETNRNMIAAGGVSYVEQYGVVNTVCSLIANLFLLNMMFAFLNLSEGYPGSRAKAFIHLLCSTVYIFYILSYVGRDGFVYWAMSLGFFLLFFKGFMPKRNIRLLVLCASGLTIPALLVFIKITISRFGGEGGSDVLGALLDYAGQQVFHFSAHYLVDAPPLGGKMDFAPVSVLKASLFGEVYEPFDREAWFAIYLEKGVVPWVFTTIIGSFLHDFGRTGCIVAIVLIFFVTRMLLRGVKISGVFKLSELIMFILMFQVVSWGVFYYRQYSAFFYIVVMLLLFFMFKFSGRAKALLILKVEK